MGRVIEDRGGDGELGQRGLRVLGRVQRGPLDRRPEDMRFGNQTLNRRARWLRGDVSRVGSGCGRDPSATFIAQARGLGAKRRSRKRARLFGQIPAPRN